MKDLYKLANALDDLIKVSQKTIEEKCRLKKFLDWLVKSNT